MGDGLRQMIGVRMWCGICHAGCREAFHQYLQTLQKIPLVDWNDKELRCGVERCS